ncbi:MAG: flagellar biosynthetic protein FliR [Candidatus Thiodiazotropha lotti]|uniref:Flagellar biosynthetic protein FliR n=1 Tax=Candidatus Thiodiazotropha lotti TaxID=2792787 RepID=A0A9E4K5J7_9GAMM|nr:flagellar biosynthetic protein FliR [Candidatus Thiodiazotropha lotti]ODB99695.1 flagellar biosynthetic protein FliR [Candidatus Thiodiazotropha endoloripes]MCG7932452.1 flagellar biosynthetic protein FliR [Candidatus Thiodiazotropha lotti]MCG7939549.1 flagellar biosynthetic protein FliR [Candidatus Thiodiazotropha lotti]MCG7988607.1 flagellar biosynthetic protein FliR [Candidatus Thiodiazotropha lotti]
MIFSEAQLNALIATYFWPMVRISAMLLAAPLFSSRQIPARLRLVLMMMIAFLVAPTLPEMPSADVLSHSGLIIMLQQLLIGIMMGFILQMVFGALVFGGQVIAYSMGLGFASMVDPANGVQVPVVSQFYLILATLLFLIFNGHLHAIELVADSFVTMPVAMDGISRNNLIDLVAWGSRLFAGGLIIALPIVGAMLMVNMGMGVVMRAAPQLNIFSVGFPITMLLGFALIWVSLPNAMSVFTDLQDEAFQHLMQTLRIAR